LLSAFYMTRQVFYVFFGNCWLAMAKSTASEKRALEHPGVSPRGQSLSELPAEPHESPRSMTGPLVILAGCSMVLGLIGTPAWPWFQGFLEGRAASFEFGRLLEGGALRIMALSSAVVFVGIGLGWWLYGRTPVAGSEQVDVLERFWPNVFALLRRKYFVDEMYEWAVVGLNSWWAKTCDWLDQWVWNGVVQLFAYLVAAISWLDRFFDEYVVNLGFDQTCRSLSRGGGLLSRLQNGRVQNYLRVIGIGLTVLVLFLLWGSRG